MTLSHLKTIFTAVIVCALGVPLMSSSAHSANLTEQEKAALQQWGNRVRGNMGPTVTPPRGRLAPEIRSAQADLWRIVQNMYSERLAKKDFHLTINIYDAATINAFMSRSENHYVKNGESVDPEFGIVRNLLGHGADGKPIYELAVSSQLLKTAATEDELAFVLAHEMSHLLQGHVLDITSEFDDHLKGWWSSQQFEAVADYEAVQAMRGKYDVGAATEMMARLFPHRIRSQLETYSAAAQDHHHEGVRISLLQGLIENLRQTDERAQPRPRTPMPSTLTLRSKGRESLSKADFEKYKIIFQKNLDDCLKNLPCFKPGGFMAAPPEEMVFYRGPSLGAEQQRSVILSALNQLEASGASKQIKVNSMLTLLSQMTKGTARSRNPWDILSQDEQNQMLHFFTRNTAGADGWKAYGFYAGDDSVLSRLSGYSAFFDKTPGLQKQLDFLTSHFEQWKQLYRQLPFEILRQLPLQSALSSIESLLETISLLDDTPRARSIKQGMIDFLKSKDLSVHAEDSAFGKLGTYIAELKKNNGVDLKFVEEAEKAIAPAMGIHARAPLPKSFSAVADPKSSEWPRREAILDIINYYDSHSVSNETRRQIFKALAVGARELNKTYAVNNYLQHETQFSVLTEALTSADITEAEKSELFEFLFSNSGYLGAPGRDSHQKKQMVDRFKDYFLKAFNKEQFVRFVEKRSTPIAHRIDELIQESSEATSAEVRNKIESEMFSAYMPLSRISTLLGFMGSDTAFRESYVRGLQWNDLRTIVKSIEDSRNLAVESMNKIQLEPLDPKRNPKKENLLFFAFSDDSQAFLVDALIATEDGAHSFEDWKTVYVDVFKQSPKSLEISPSYRDQIQHYLETKWFSKMSLDQIIDALKVSEIRDAFSSEKIADYLTRYTKMKLRGQLNDSKQVRQVIMSLEDEFELKTEAPEVRNLFKNQLLHELNAQPQDSNVLFPNVSEDLTSTQASKAASTPIRGLSGMVSMTRTASPSEQIMMIEYLMGRSDQVPDFFVKAANRVESRLPMMSLLRIARARLSESGIAERVLVANSFLAGPNGIVESQSGLNTLTEHLLRGTDPKHLSIAKTVSESLLSANQEQKSLAIAYLFGQKTKVGQAALTEGDMLASLLLAHGVPGIKFGQYLGFTKGFKAFGKALEDFQDQAAPMEYADVIDHLRKSYGERWSPHLRVKKILGFGSVNIAVELHNELTQENEVISILRPHVQAATTENFRKFNRFLEELARRGSQETDYSFLRGLSGIVQKSVALEFDKNAAFEMQRQVFDHYHGSVDGWSVESVEALRRENDGIFMRKAEGVTAKTLLRENPEAYRQAMKAISQVEMDILLGIGKDGNPNPVPLHANPDFHDGQVIVDVKNRRVQILDFGQAVSISNEERGQAVEFLRLISGTETSSGALRTVNAASRKAIGKDIFTLSEMAEILKNSSDRMDLFIKLISKMSLKGYDLPLPVVHWVLAANRQIVLGDKIGIGNRAVFRNLILARGISQSTFNRARLGLRKVKSFFEKVKPKSMANCLIDRLRSLGP